MTTSGAALFDVATAETAQPAAPPPISLAAQAAQAAQTGQNAQAGEETDDATASNDVTASTGENNAATTPQSGINVTTMSQSLTATAAGNTGKHSSKDENSENSDKKKGDQPANDLLTPLSTQVGTVFSESTVMPAIAQNLPTHGTDAKTTGDLLAALTAVKPERARSTSATAGAAADASQTAAAATASIQGQAGVQASSQDAITEKRVALQSNDQFVDVIRQTLNEAPVLTPQRIAVELQTPPGETVTVYFSQSNGQLRAQLSASDSSSLQWLQQQVGGLKEAGSGSGVVWLPPQLDNPNSGNGQQGGSGQNAHYQQQQQQNGSADADMDDRALAEAIFGGSDLNLTLTENR